MTLEIRKAGIDQKEIVANLVELYIYDLNDIAPDTIMFELDQRGKFGYPRFQRFWEEPGCAAYLFYFNGRPAGFSLTHDAAFYHRDQNARVIGEFGILKMYRNQGIGLKAASYVMQQQPGFWEMRVIDENARAVYFWNKVLTQLCGSNYTIYEKNDHQWIGKVYVGNVPK